MMTTLHQSIAFLLSVHFIQYTLSQVDTTGCSPSPLTCFDPVRARNLCNTDADCPSGKTCCYKSCFKQCVPKYPCSNVVCKPGYLCQVMSTPCVGETCNKEPTCLPAEAFNCPPSSTSPACPPGYQRVKDQYGCRTGVCQQKPLCPGYCRLGCLYGQKVGADGCPLCECNPVPSNPCKDVSCSWTQECRLMSQTPTSTKIPATLRAGCLPKSLFPSAMDMTCGLRDATTAGLPIIDSAGREIDCATSACPAHAVCVTFASNTNRCCWQHTQLLVTSGPKVGECPYTPMLRYDVQPEGCEIDANCPGTYKCCYVNMERGRTEHIGVCLPPIHVTLSDRQLCSNSYNRLWFFMAMGVC